MPQTLPLPSPVVSRARHCTALNFALPIGGALACAASFTERETMEDGTHFDTPEASVSLTQAEIAALPAFAAAYAQLSAAVHTKRASYDVPAPPDA
jgi:hypothetical protein